MFFFIQDEKSKTFTCLNVLCAGTVIFIYCDLQVDRIGDFQNNTSQKKKIGTCLILFQIGIVKKIYIVSSDHLDENIKFSKSHLFVLLCNDTIIFFVYN